MNDSVLNINAVIVDKNSNLGALVEELKKRQRIEKISHVMNMSSHTDSYSDGHTDYGGYGDNYNDDGHSSHSDSGCFITTATLNSKGCLNDDCYELTLARLFRDTFMKEKYPELILEYREIAPQIVASINKRNDKMQIYDRIWEEYLSKCLNEIEKGEYESAKTIYCDMVVDLRALFL